MPLSQNVAARPIVTCDIETWGLSALPQDFACGVVYDGEDGIGFRYLPDMRNYLLSPKFAGHTIYAHNGGKYDYLSIFGNFWQFFGADNVTMNESRFIQMVWRNREHRSAIYFRDSLNIIPTSLAKIGEKFGYEKGETPSVRRPNVGARVQTIRARVPAAKSPKSSRRSIGTTVSEIVSFYGRPCLTFKIGSVVCDPHYLPRLWPFSVASSFLLPVLSISRGKRTWHLGMRIMVEGWKPTGWGNSLFPITRMISTRSIQPPCAAPDFPIPPV